jgi:hypothetical protein
MYSSSHACPPKGRAYFPPDVSKLRDCPFLPNLFQFLDPTKGTDGYVTTLAEWQERRL